MPAAGLAKIACARARSGVFFFAFIRLRAFGLPAVFLLVRRIFGVFFFVLHLRALRFLALFLFLRCLFGGFVLFILRALEFFGVCFLFRLRAFGINARQMCKFRCAGDVR